MPVAALCVKASGFVFGLAHPDVQLSAQVIQLIRDDLAVGVVVSSDLSSGEIVDEYSDVGTVVAARNTGGAITVSTIANAPPTIEWRSSDVEVTSVVGIYTYPRHVMAYDVGEVRQQFSICFTA